MFCLGVEVFKCVLYTCNAYSLRLCVCMCMTHSLRLCVCMRIAQSLRSCALCRMSTLFVANLNSRIKESDLVALLYERFSPFGEVIAVQLAKGKDKARGKPFRGTAFVSLRNDGSSAVRNLNGQQFMGKPMRIESATKKSDSIAKLAGTWKPKYKPTRRLMED